MKKFFKYLLITLLVIMVLLQLYPKHNDNKTEGINPKDISMVHNLPDDVQKIFKTSCYDCHSNHTNYPWYASLQPVSLWLEDHINEGKDELNFSIFGDYSLRRQYRKLKEINEQLKENKMPLSSYTLIHRDAKLSQEQKLAVAKWATSLRDSFSKVYPADSLIPKKR